LSRAERRKHPRIEIQNIISYVCKDDSGNPIKEGTGKTINISKGGILIETRNAFEWQEIILLAITTEDGLIRVKGKVVYCNAADFGMFRTGIQFLEPDEKILLFVISLMKTYL
jgi:c-di-GMP-binding flagellar brake protein YcgR